LNEYNINDGGKIMRNPILKNILFFSATILCILLVHAIPVSAEQNHWVLVYQGKDETKTYMDMNKLISEKNNVKFWTKTIYNINNSTFKEHVEKLRGIGQRDDLKEVVFFKEINCNENVLRVLTTIFYDIKGEVIIRIENNDPQWETIPPNSIGDFQKKLICTHVNQ
jgi:hypothetical protein